MIRMVVLAAGASSRMGRPKSELPVGARGRTFLSTILERACIAGLPDIVVVAGAHSIAARGPLRDRRVRIVHNPGWAQGQLTSLVAGLDAPSVVPIEAVAVTLVDVPLVSADTIVRLIRAWRETRAPIVRPARGDVHGHPVIFDAAILPELRRADPAVGAKSVVRAHAAEILNVPVDDPGAYLDIDTPEEYAQRVR